MTSHAIDDVVVLKPESELCEGPECDALEHQLESLVSQGRRVVIDLEGTRFLTAHALGVLAHAERSATRFGGRIVLCGAADLERWLLQLTHLADALPIFGSEQEAVRSLLVGQASA